MFKLLQEVQVIQLYIWMRGKMGGKARTHRMFLLPKSLSWTGRGGSALKDVTEDSRNGPGAIMEGFMEEAMNTTESDAENYNNHNNNQHVLNTYYIPGPAP